jgi:hypothetical protein
MLAAIDFCYCVLLALAITLRYSWVQKEDREACLIFSASVITSLYQMVIAKQKTIYRQFCLMRFLVAKSFTMELGVF